MSPRAPPELTARVAVKKTEMSVTQYGVLMAAIEADAEEKARAEERAAVVAWLRCAPEAGGLDAYHVLARTADAIEQGAHLKAGSR